MNRSVSLNPDNYERIARAIAFIRQHHLTQPDLAMVASHVGLSESHFQKLFTQWAGISPKRFLQYLTLEYAKQRIAQTQSILDLATDVGLSSPGRLHDLFVNIEAMSPGEFKAGGASLHIHYGLHNTPFGKALIATTPRGVCNLAFLEAASEAALETTLETKTASASSASQFLEQAWPNAKITYSAETTRPLCQSIFSMATAKEKKPLTLLIKGTNFQLQVWRALLNLPFGSLTTYKTIATMIDRPRATRAVGTAIGKNPIGYLIPCHRVIRSSGELGGYLWGCDRKLTILGWEASRTHDF